MSNHLQKQAENLPEAEFEKYYKEHSKEFEEVELLQLTHPETEGAEFGVGVLCSCTHGGPGGGRGGDEGGSREASEGGGCRSRF